MEKTDKISARQLFAMIFLGLLSPTVRILPRVPVALGGRAAWLSPVPAAVFAALYVLFVGGLLKNRAADEGLGQILERSAGKLAGKIVSLLCALWLTLYTGFEVRSLAERLLSSVYGEGNTVIFIVVSVVITVIAAAGSTKSLARTTELATLVISAVIVLVLAFSASDIRYDYLFPVTYLDAGSIALGAVPIIDIACFGTFFLFLLGHTEKAKDGAKKAVGWSVRLMLVALGVMAVTVGGCSAPLALKLQNAFFSMIRNIVLLGVVERVEVLIVAVWVITDFTLIAAAVMTAAEIWRGVLEVRRRTAFVYPTAAAATALAFLIAPNAFRLRSWSEIIVPLVNMSFTLLIIPLTLVIGRLRKKI